MATSLSPRHRVLRAIGKSVGRQKGGKLLRDTVDDDDLPEGYMQLHSFFVPGLLYGTYELSAEQFVQTLPDKSDQLLLKNNQTSPQLFNVIVPQFSLPAGAVHSFFPPSGQPVDAAILPHIVFNDSHLPWECPVDKTDPSSPGTIPWLALFVFTQDELKLSQDQMKDISPSISKQSSMLDISMTASAFLLLDTVAIPDFRDSHQPSGLDEKIDGTDNINAIFIETDQFRSLFAELNDPGLSKQSFPYMDRYQQLAHVRNVNTLHTADAGTKEQGTFSVVISSRTGPLNTKNTTDLIVHLVSLENVSKIDYNTTKLRVGLASLYSWSFKALSAENAFNVQDTMVNIGKQADQLLRAGQDVLSSFTITNPEEKSIHDRLNAGYSLVRYRTRLADETVAYVRGPLSPVLVPPATSTSGDAWPQNSHTGTDYQILDSTTGIMDISYSTAWQLGRSLAIADQPFCAALGRIRHIIHQTAMNRLKVALAGDIHRTKEQAISGLNNLHSILSAFGTDKLSTPLGSQSWFRGPKKNLHVNPQPQLRASVDNMNKYLTNVQSVSQSLTMAYDPSTAGSNTNPARLQASLLYNEFNTPVNTDWASVLSWVLDHLFLAGIPPQHLVGDPSYLPRESIRFFHVDQNWISAMIDGALSVGNQLTYDEDSIRQAIKSNINTYLRSQGKSAQIPIFGFLLHSHLVSVFPDLKVEVALPKDDPRTPNPFTKRVAEEILLVLIDRQPGDSDFTTITITQPPHQQCYRLGTHLSEDQLVYDVREAFTIDVPANHGNFKTVGDPITVKPDPTQVQVYDWKKNVLNVPLYSLKAKQTLLANKPDEFQDDDPSKPGSAALVALELNDSIWFLQMTSATKPGSNADRGPLQLHGGSPLVPNSTVQAKSQKTQRIIEPSPAKHSTDLDIVTASKSKAIPIGPPPSLPRSPNMRRIRPSKHIYDTIPKPTTPNFKPQFLMTCGSPTDPQNKHGVLPSPLPDVIPTQSLIFKLFLASWSSSAAPVLPCTEIAIHLPLDVPSFKPALNPPPSVATVMPLLNSTQVQAHFIKFLGAAQVRWSCELIRSEQYLTVRLLPKYGDALFGDDSTKLAMKLGDGEAMSFMLGGMLPFSPASSPASGTAFMTYIPVTWVWAEQKQSPAAGTVTGPHIQEVATSDFYSCIMAGGTN